MTFKLIILHLKKVRELLKKFIRVQVRHVPRAENTRADALAKLAITPQVDLDRPIPVEHLLEPSVNVDTDRRREAVIYKETWTLGRPWSMFLFSIDLH